MLPSRVQLQNPPVLQYHHTAYDQNPPICPPAQSVLPAISVQAGQDGERRGINIERVPPATEMHSVQQPRQCVAVNPELLPAEMKLSHLPVNTPVRTRPGAPEACHLLIPRQHPSAALHDGRQPRERHVGGRGNLKGMVNKIQ